MRRRRELLFTTLANGKGFSSCNPLLQELAAPGLRGEHCCPGERHETLTWEGRRPRKRQKTLFIRGMKGAQLLDIPAAFLLHLYFTCGTDRVNDNKKFSFKSWQGEVLFP